MFQTGERIVSLRKEKGIKQADLCNAIGIPQASLSQYESCNREVSPEWLLKIAEFFGVSIEYLMGATEIRKSPRDYDTFFINDGTVEMRNGELYERLEQLPPSGRYAVKNVVEALLSK